MGSKQSTTNYELVTKSNPKQSCYVPIKGVIVENQGDKIPSIYELIYKIKYFFFNFYIIIIYPNAQNILYPDGEESKNA